MAERYFAYGRTALKFGLINSDIQQGDVILIPEYICDVVLHPFRQLKIEYRYYKIYDDFQPDWNDIEKKIDSNTRALMMVHYFGQPQNIEQFQTFCIDNNLLLIEDNAHGYGGLYNKKMLGTFGDIGFASPRKLLKINYGGILYINSQSQNRKIDIKPIPKKKIIKKRLKNLIPSKFFFRKKPKLIQGELFAEKIIDDYEIDKYSKKFIDMMNLEELRKNRQAIFDLWNSFAKMHNLKLPPIIINADIVPFCSPVLTKNIDERNYWLEWGWRNNIKVTTWPKLPSDLLENKHSIEIWDRLICFPIDQRFNRNKLAKKLKIILEV